MFLFRLSTKYTSSSESLAKIIPLSVRFASRNVSTDPPFETLFVSLILNVLGTCGAVKSSSLMNDALLLQIIFF